MLCSHTICEYCIIRRSTLNSTTCAICKADHRVTVTKESNVVINDKYEKLLLSFQEKQLKTHLLRIDEECSDQEERSNKKNAVISNFLPELFPDDKEMMAVIEVKSKGARNPMWKDMGINGSIQEFFDPSLVNQWDQRFV